MYRLVSQANNFEVLLEGTSFDIEIPVYLNFTNKKKKSYSPFLVQFIILFLPFESLTCLLIYMCNLKIFDIQYSPYS